MMDKDRFYQAVGDLDEEFLEEFETMENMEGYTMKKKMNWLAAAACCVLLMGAGVVTGLTDLPQNVSRFLGTEDETQIKYLANAATSVDLFVVGEQGDIHIKEMMGDDNAIYVFFDFIAPEGTVLDKNYYEFLWAEPLMVGGQYHIHQLEDEDKTDNKLSFAFFILQFELNGRELALKLCNLYGYDNEADSTKNRDLVTFDNEKFQLVLDEEYIMENCPEILETSAFYEGEWKSEPFNVKFTDISNSYNIKNSVTSGGIEYKLTKVSISPYAITFQGEVKADSYKDLDYGINDITVHYADGTSEEMSGGGGAGKIFSFTCDFHPLLTQEIVAVTYMGERIELK